MVTNSDPQTADNVSNSMNDIDIVTRLQEDVSHQLAFQKRWRITSMVGYVGTTIGSLICSASASVFAGMDYSRSAAVFAAAATVLLGAEKTLMFREKWKFHLLMYTKLQVL